MSIVFAGIAAVPRRACVDRRTSAAGVLRHVRRHCHRAPLIDEVFRVVGLVGAERDRARPVGARFDHGERRYPLGVAVSPASDTYQPQGPWRLGSQALLHRPWLDGEPCPVPCGRAVHRDPSVETCVRRPSQRVRKRIEEAFGWIKTVARQEKTKFRGRGRVGWAFTFAAAAYNLVRLPKLIAEKG